jgi:iron complex transport system substrate-binding protein
MVARLARHKANMAKLRKAMPRETRNVLFAVSAPTTFNMHNSQAYTPSVLQSLGLRATEQRKPGEDPYHELTLETLFSLNPDIMFIAKSGTNTMADKWAESPIWRQIKAVRNNQVFYVNQDLWSRWRGISTAEVIGQQALRLLYKKYVRLEIG